MSLPAKTTSNIRIRLARETDAEAISSLLFDSFVEYKSLYNPESFAATAIPPDQIASRISEGPIWIAVAGERISDLVEP